MCRAILNPWSVALNPRPSCFGVKTIIKRTLLKRPSLWICWKMRNRHGLSVIPASVTWPYKKRARKSCPMSLPFCRRGAPRRSTHLRPRRLSQWTATSRWTPDRPQTTKATLFHLVMFGHVCLGIHRLRVSEANGKSITCAPIGVRCHRSFGPTGDLPTALRCASSPLPHERGKFSNIPPAETHPCAIMTL